MSFVVSYVSPIAVDFRFHRMSDGKKWNPASSGSWDTSPTYANSFVAGTNGSSEEAGMYTATISASNFASPGLVRIQVHDHASPNLIMDVIEKWIYDVGQQESAAIYYVNLITSFDATTDYYEWRWYRDGIEVTATSPTIQVVDNTGADLIASSSGSTVGSTGAFKKSTTSGRVAAGTTGEAIFTATIDGATRTYKLPVGR